MELKPEIIERFNKLEAKYQAMGQDLVSYLDGLLYADYLTYWDYIKIDTLLSLQNSKTNIPDEQVFIIYHQITELYFKLVLIEMETLAYTKSLTSDFFTQRLIRINRYFENLAHSFDIMTEGMEKEQFLKFRMSLLPASGFQSAQYRLIEIRATEFHMLIDKDLRDKIPLNTTFEEMYEHLYWKNGSIELASGKKTLTLQQFDKKYSHQFLNAAKEYKKRNLWTLYKSLSEKDQQNENIIKALRLFDVNVNVNWPLAHYKSAVRHLNMDSAVIKATGGTNWQKYLPPKFQKRIFYPDLWEKKEIKDWGKNWVDNTVFSNIP